MLKDVLLIKCVSNEAIIERRTNKEAQSKLEGGEVVHSIITVYFEQYMLRFSKLQRHTTMNLTTSILYSGRPALESFF